MPNDSRDELIHLVSLAGIEMSILGDSLGHLGSTLRGSLSIKQCREFLPWKRGEKLSKDLLLLSQHCALLGELLSKLESQEEAQGPTISAEAAEEAQD